MSKSTEKTDKMRSAPVNKLMLSMGIPIIISMMLQALYNIVDSAFVSNMAENGEAALNALTLAFPMQMLMIAVSIGTGVGANALLSKSMGAGDDEKAAKTAGNAMFLGLVIYIVFLLFGLFGVDIYIGFQSSNPLIVSMASQYLKLCCVASFGIVFFSVFEKLLQSTGHSMYSTIAQISGAVCNIVLDPILIYGLFGLPEMGVYGAALATVIGQVLSFALAIIFHFKVNKHIRFGMKYLKPSANIIKEIYSIGLPAIISQALMSVMTYGLNIIMGRADENLVTAYGLYYKIQQFILFAAFGLRDAITPIISFSHGMGNKNRIRDGIKYGQLYTLIIMLLGLLITELFTEPLAGVFSLSGETEALCISAIRIISVSFIFAGACIAFQAIFQALGGGIESLIISVCRQIIFVLPVAYMFTKLMTLGENEYIVWFTFPIAEFISAIISMLLMVRIDKKQISLLPDAPEADNGEAKPAISAE